MKAIILAIATLTIPGLACAVVPAGPDSLNRAFVSMLDHQPGRFEAVRPSVGDSAGFQFERHINAIARSETSSLELGFAHMLARTSDVPAALTVRGERDPVGQLVTAGLQAQSPGIQRHAGL